VETANGRTTPQACRDAQIKVQTLWDAAAAAFSSGDLTTAVSGRASVKEKLESLAPTLHVKTS
jgi:hypothetical protein